MTPSLEIDEAMKSRNNPHEPKRSDGSVANPPGKHRGKVEDVSSLSDFVNPLRNRFAEILSQRMANPADRTEHARHSVTHRLINNIQRQQRMAKSIPIQTARQQLARINAELAVPHLLIGGLAVQQYVATRDSHDIDLVCDYEIARKLAATLYPTNDWQTVERNDDAYRPTFSITHLSEDYGEIKFGPKITERGAYEFLDWDYLLQHAKTFTLGDQELSNIKIPSCTHLAFSKLISFLSRSTTHVQKRRQDLQDLTDLSNQTDFEPISFLAILRKSRAQDYVETHFRLSDEENAIFQKSTFYNLLQVFGKTNLRFDAPVSQQMPAESPPTEAEDHSLRLIEKEVVKIALKHSEKKAAKPQRSDLVLVLDIQQDFFEGGALAAERSSELIKPLNHFIKESHERGATCVFARDWHPEDHSSFDKWGKHCVQGEPGAEFHTDLHRPHGSLVVDIGATNDSDGYSPFDDIRLCSLVATGDFRAVFVTGIALEFCVLAACRDALWFGLPVVAIEPLIVAASERAESKQHVWSLLESMGVIRTPTIPQFTT